MDVSEDVYFWCLCDPVIHQPILPGINLKFCNLNTEHPAPIGHGYLRCGDKTRMVRVRELITAREIISTAHTQPLTTHHNIEEDLRALRCLLTNLLCTEILL